LTADGPGLAAFLARRHTRVVLDLGCGDARSTARLASHEPSALVIGIDANLDPADRVIRRARRAPERGGLANLALVRAAADRLPAELAGKVDELRVDLPWGSLLEGLLRGEPPLLAGMVHVLAPGGRVRIVLNARALPADLSPDEVAVNLERALEATGLSDVRAGATAVTPDTGWGKRLSGGRPLEVIVAEGRGA